MQYALGIESPIVYVARHLAKRAPSEWYSARRSRRPSSPSVTVSPSAPASGLAPRSTLMPGMMPSASAVAVSEAMSIFSAPIRLFPFDGSGWLACDVVGDPVDTGNLVDDARRHALEQVGGEPRPVGGHRVFGRDRADHDRILVGAA